MSPADQRRWAAFQRRAGTLSPELAAIILRAFARIRLQMSEGEFAKLLESASVERVIATALGDAQFERAFTPVRSRLRSVTEESVRYFAKELPKGGKVDGVIGVAFDVLNPRVIDAIRMLDSKVMQTLKGDIRETVRAFVENGLRDGLNPRAIARGVRETVGLAPNQSKAVTNFEAMLRGGPNATVYKGALDAGLRDRRFDSTLARMRKDGTKLSEGQIEKMTAVYSRRMVAFHAESVARTATLDALKLGQRLSWQDAINKEIVDGDRLMKRWVGVMDDRERESHVRMEGETVPFDVPFSNGQMIPGEDEYNCRCITAVFLARSA